MDRSVVLRIRGLTLSRPGRGDEPDYNLSVSDFEALRGDRIGLIGDSGSGKTSFLEVLGLIGWPDAVETYDFAPDPDFGVMDLCPAIRDRQSSLLSNLRAQCMGFVLQDGGLLPYLTVRQNAQLAQDLSGNLSDPGHIADMAANIGIAEYLDRYQSALSGGQRQRAAVLRALSTGAPVLLADEPTAALDPRNSDAVLSAMARSSEDHGATVIVASHNADLLARFGFRIFRVHVDEGSDARHATLEAA